MHILITTSEETEWTVLKDTMVREKKEERAEWGADHRQADKDMRTMTPIITGLTLLRIFAWPHEQKIWLHERQGKYSYQGRAPGLC
jgi:hypothetical protein